MKKKAELFLLIIMFFSGLISCFSFVDYFWFSCDVRSISQCFWRYYHWFMSFNEISIITIR